MTTLQRVWDEAVQGAARRDWRIGYTGDGAGHVTVPNKAGWYYVRLGAEGSTTVTQARNHPKLGVPPDPDLPIRVRRDNGILTIYGDEPLSAGAVPTELGDLSDVITGGEQSHQVLQYRSADSKWLNQYLALYTGPAQAATIAGGTLSVVGGSHWQVSAESGTSGTIATISGDQAGQRVVIRPAIGHTILLDSGAGNLSLHNGDCLLADADHAIELLYVTGTPNYWIELQRALAAGGGLPYLGGAGIAVSDQTIDIDLATPSGLTLAGDKLALDDSVAGSGLSINSKVMAVNLAVISGLEIVSDALRLRDDVAGAGLTISNKILAVGAGDGISVIADAVAVRLNPAASGLHFVAGGLAVNVKEGIELDLDALRVDEQFSFDWTGTHTFHSDPQINANLDFIGGGRSITSSGTNHLTLDPGGDLILPADETFRSSDYADGIPITGFSLFPDPSGDRQLTIFGLKVDELHARAFVADMVRVDIGEEWWGKSLGLLYDDFTTPSTIGGTATMVLEDAPAIAGQLFSSGDWVMLRVIDLPAAGTTGTATIAYVWGQVSVYVDLVADENGVGRQQWTFTLRDGPFSTLIQKGSVVVCFGVAGQGYIHLSALDSAQGPWIQIGDWNGANPYTAGNRTARTQIGRLDSLSDPDMTPTGWGLYSDNAYLRGMLRTAETIMDDDGLSIQTANEFTSQSLISWWPDINNQIGNPDFSIKVYHYTDPVFSTVHDRVHLLLNQRETADNAILWISAQGPGGGAGNPTLELASTGVITMHNALQFVVEGHTVPAADLTYDLGEAARRWRNLYVDQLFVSGSISGDTLSGAEWEHAGSMIIDANSSGATTVSVTNQGTGTASLAVEGNITLGGTVNNVDINDHVDNPNAHHALAAGGDGVTVSGAQVVAVNTTVVRTPRTLTAGDGLDGGGDLSADRAFAVDSSVVRTSRVITAGLGLSGGGALAANLTLNVVLGQGLRLDGDAVAIDLASNSGLTFVETELLLNSAIAGAGLTMDAARVLSVGAGDGVTVAVDSVAVRLMTPSGLSAAGGELRIVDAFAGAGLTMVDKIMAVGAGAGITVAADSVAVRLATNAGLQLTGGELMMGAPTTLTVATLNMVTGATHAHDIDSTADANSAPGKILHATSAGGLLLGTLGVNGNVDITGGGDLTVGLNVIFADASANSVGFGRVPDPQFMVDVNGPLRADYLIGKHAIQIKDAVLIAHYDGMDPLYANYAGEANGHFGQIGTMTGGIIFRPGNFGKAVQAAGAATNRITNPSLETNTTNWTALGGAALTRTLEEAYAGSYSLKIATPAGVANKGAVYTQAVATGPITYTASLYIKGDGQGNDLFLRARNQADNANLATTTFSLDPGEGWKLVQVTWTSDAAQTTLRLRIHDAAAAALTYYVDALMVEQTAYATPYCDGSLLKDGSDTGHVWTSTVHGSTSARTAARLSYPLANLPYGRGTVMLWARAPWGAQATARPQRSTYWHALNAYLRVGTTAQYQALIHGATINAGALADSNWHHLALTWDVYINRAALYVDGVSIGAATGLVAAAYTDTALWVGCRAGGDPLDGWIDDFATVARELPANEILSIYESDAPVFAESSVFSFRATPNGLVWADDEGLWMKDANALAVAGFYGGEAASKSWAGTTLSQGDIFFGRYGAGDGGWLRFDRDGAAGSPLLTLGYQEASVLELSSTAAKLQAVNLEILNATAGAVLGVFGAAAPPVGGWGGISSIAQNDVMIGDRSRGNMIWWNDDAAEVYIGSNLAGKSHLYLTTTQMALKVGPNERVTITNGGDLTIRNSSGQPVFTFNASLGAEFTLPLTLGTNGGIYQGTGTFASPTTGLKVFNSSGIGKLSTYNTGVEQVTLDTDGKLKAGAGNVILDVNGLTIIQGTTLANSIVWSTGVAEVAHVSARQTSLANIVETDVVSSATRDSQWINSVHAPSGKEASISWYNYVNNLLQNAMAFGDPLGALTLTQNSTTGTRPVLRLEQDDLSEEFIEFAGTVLAGNPIEAKGAKNLTTTHFVRMSLNGSPVYLAVGTIA